MMSVKRFSLMLACSLLLVGLANAETAQELAREYAGIAVQQYATVQAERQTVEIAAAKRREAFGMMLPDLSAKSRYTQSNGGREIKFDVNDMLPSSVLPVDIPATVIPFLRETEQETKVSVVQPLFAGGGLYQNWRAASQAELASKASLKSVENGLVYGVQKAAYDAFSARELVRMRSNETAQAREQLRTVREKYAAQMLPLGEVKRAEAALASAQSDSITAVARAEVARASLNRYVGKPFGSPLPEMEESETLPPLPVTLEDAISRAKSTRPEIHQLDASLGSVHSNLKASRSSYLPNLVFAAEYGYQGEEYKFDSESDYSMASLVLNWNLFKGGQRSAKVQQAKLAERQLEFKRVELDDNVRLDVTASWLQANSQMESWKASRRGLDAASEGYRMTEEMFREGLASQLQLLDARATLSSARTAEIASRYAYLTALADLDRSMGTAFEGDVR